MLSEKKDGAASLFGQPRAVVEGVLPQRERVRCPLCDLEPRPFAVDFQGFQLARCPGCGVEFETPRPSFTDLATKVYIQVYNRAEESSSLSPGRRSHFSRQLCRLEQILGGRGYLLDVGCGAGAFLSFARERGWEPAGTDIEVNPSAQASGAKVWRGQLGQIDFGGQRFDAIRYHHVLEHTQNPLAELRRAGELLRPGGALVLSVPNLAGLSPRLKNWQSQLGLKAHRWRHYAALHHLWFFTPRTLRRFVKAARFTVVHWETPVEARDGRPPWLTVLFRLLLEAPRWGSNLDFYCRAR